MSGVPRLVGPADVRAAARAQLELRRRRRQETAEPREPEPLRAFAARVMPSIEWHWHLELLIEELQHVLDGDVPRLLIEAPPRYGKSLSVSHLLPACELWNRPESVVGMGCSGAHLARKNSKRARTFYRLGGGRLAADSQAAEGWETSEGGGMWAKGIGSDILGWGWHLGVIDDPFGSPMEGKSVRAQEEVWSWYGGTYLNRMEVRGASPRLVIMHQRLAEGDLVGRVIEAEKDSPDPQEWRLLKLQAIKRPVSITLPPSVHLVTDTREEGEALCPAYHTVTKLEAMERRDTAGFASLYQQEPLPDAGGDVFHRDWFAFAGPVDADHWLRAETLKADLDRMIAEGFVPQAEIWVRGWDFAYRDDPKRDATASALGMRHSGDVCLWVDVTEDRLESGDVEQRILAQAEADGPEVEIAIPKEPAGGIFFVDRLERKLTDMGRKVHVIPTTGSKRVRALPHAGAANPGPRKDAGRVQVLRRTALGRLVDQHHKFSGLSDAEHDDIVDAASTAFIVLDRPARLPGIVLPGRSHEDIMRRGARR